MLDLVKEFIISGKLGFLVIGINKQDVESRMGLPSEFSKRKQIEIWKFDDLQISFDKDKLICIAIYFNEQGETILPVKLKSNIGAEKFSKSLQAFTSILANQKINFMEYLPLTFDKQVCLIVESGVHIYFLENNLHSLQISEFI